MLSACKLWKDTVKHGYSKHAFNKFTLIEKWFYSSWLYYIL